MSDQDRIEKLHEKCKKLTSDELIMTLFQMNGAFALGIAKSRDEQLKKIFKTYLVRALLREGHR